MNPRWNCDSEDDLEHGEMLEKTFVRNEDELGHKIPKIFRRSLLYVSKNTDVKKLKKSISLNTSPQESLLNIDDTYKNQQKILDLQHQLGVTIVQKNGQRKLGGPPPGWVGPPPGAACEVFVGRIPRTVYEDVLYPIFSQVGEIYEMRLMMNFSGTNRGFCFVMYTKPEYAQEAIKKLNNYPINDGWCLGVVKSVNNCRLHITELPANTDAKALIKKICPLLEDIDEISVFTNLSNYQVKHALISFKTHRGAAMARRSLLPERNNYFGKTDVRIEWAHPKISITNVLEECGKFNSDGKLIITNTVIHNDKKNHSNDRKKKSTSSPKLQNVEIIKNRKSSINDQKFVVKKESHSETVDYNLSNSYSAESCNNNSSCEECQMSQYRHSVSSDGSLSDFSKSSECDECRCSGCSPNCGVSFYYNVSKCLDSKNCSVVRYPWGLNQNSNVLKQNLSVRQNTAIYHIPFPWRTMSIKNNVPLPNTMINFNQSLKYHVPKLVINNYNSINNINARPILNRNL